MNGCNDGGSSGDEGVKSPAERMASSGEVSVPDREEMSTSTALTAARVLRLARDFLRVSGTGLLYALSALSILYGISRIIGPVLATSGRLAETLPCFGALQSYELALFAVLLLIVLWRQATRDTWCL